MTRIRAHLCLRHLPHLLPLAPMLARMVRENGIKVTAGHNHMLDEQPRLFFVHFWATDDTRKLAWSLKAALAHVNILKG